MTRHIKNIKPSFAQYITALCILNEMRRLFDPKQYKGVMRVLFVLGSFAILSFLTVTKPIKAVVVELFKSLVGMGFAWAVFFWMNFRKGA